MKFKPSEGVKVRDPFSRRHVPDEGVEIPDSSPELSFYLRRVRAGDMVVVPEPESNKPAPKKVTGNVKE